MSMSNENGPGPTPAPVCVEEPASLKRQLKSPRKAKGKVDQLTLPFDDENVRPEPGPTIRIAEPVAQDAPGPGPGPAPTVVISEPAAKEAPGRALELPETFVEVLLRLSDDPEPNRRRIETKCALRMVGKVLRRPLRDVPAKPILLRPLLNAATPASAGMTPNRWGRVRTLTLQALADVGFDIVPGRDVAGVGANWASVRAQLPTQTMKHGLSAFMSHCTRAEIEPDAVTQATFEEFKKALEVGSLRRNPEVTYRITVRRWNRAISFIPDLPRTPIPLATHRHFYSHPWEDFPESFQADVEAFLTDSGSRDEFDDDYVVPVKPSTVNLRRRQLRELASMLVASGFDIDLITSLAVLVEPKNVSAALRQQRERSGSITPAIGGKTWLACIIARHWVKNREHADKLGGMARKLSKKQEGMTPRNREQLRQFDLKANRDALLMLPEKVFAEAERDKLGTAAETLRVMAAMAVGLLLAAPMRIGNIVEMEPERHLINLGRGPDRNVHILIPGHETKTGKPFEMLLPPWTARLMDIYLATYRGRIFAGTSRFLFPNRVGKVRSTVPFARAIQLLVKRETGLHIHVHLFRQLAGKLHLDLNPNDIETVRMIFGHTNSSTTWRYYAEQKTDLAFARYDETLSRLRDEADPPPSKPGGRKGPKKPRPVK